MVEIEKAGLGTLTPRWKLGESMKMSILADEVGMVMV